MLPSTAEALIGAPVAKKVPQVVEKSPEGDICLSAGCIHTGKSLDRVSYFIRLSILVSLYLYYSLARSNFFFHVDYSISQADREIVSFGYFYDTLISVFFSWISISDFF